MHTQRRSRKALGSALVALSLALVGDRALAASLRVSPASVSVAPGETTVLTVSVNADGDAINSVDGTLLFPADLVEVLSVSREGSVLPLWVEEPSYSNAAGKVSFSGGVPTPGYSGSWGKVLSFTVRGKGAGAASFTFSSSAVRANDGLGTDVLAAKAGATVAVAAAAPAVTPPPSAPSNRAAAPAIASRTHPDQAAWYADASPEFSWNLPAGAIAVRTLLSASASALPSVLYSPAIGKKTVEDVADGRRYFAVQVQTADGWGEVGTYRVNVDATPPEPFSIEFAPGRDEWDAQPSVTLAAEDETSGVAHYLVSIDGGEPEEVAAGDGATTYRLPRQLPGEHELAVYAVDLAGNARDASARFTVLGLSAPTVAYRSERVDEGGAIAARGSSEPLVGIVLSLRDADGRLVLEERGQADASGGWSIASSKPVPAGSYQLSARAENGEGASSAESAPLSVSVRSSVSAAVGEFAVRYLSVAFLALTSALALGLLALGVIRVWAKVFAEIAAAARWFRRPSATPTTRATRPTSPRPTARRRRGDAAAGQGGSS